MTATTTAIPVFDYREQYAALADEIHAAIEAVLASGSLILGPCVREFEQQFAAYLDPRGEGLGVGNGTDALGIALRALEIGPGDEVITVANTAIPTVSAIRMTGARPVFADIDPGSLLIDLDDVEARITHHTKAIIPVHLYGNAVDMPRLMRLAARHGVAVVEDRAQSCGTTWQGQATGTFGDVGCFSFYPTKNLGAYGDGGFCYTRSGALAQAMRQIRTYGCQGRYCAEREGVNSRLDELQAAILLVKLRHLDEHLAQRREVARVYQQHLADEVTRPTVAEAVDHSHHLLVVCSPNREALAARLRAEAIGYGIHYPTPIHRMPGYEFLGHPAGSLPVTERMAERVVSLPCYPELDHEAVRKICWVVNDVTASAT